MGLSETAAAAAVGVRPANVQLLDDIKQERVALRIPIRNGSGTEIGHLLPLTKSSLEDDRLISTFVRWRNRNLEGWLDQRPVTEEGTKNWLNQVVTDPTRMTFTIYFGEKMVGRCGFLRQTREDNESDGLIRGERGGGIDFMHRAQVAGLRWQFETLGISSVLSKVLSSNEAALNSCRRLGYAMDQLSASPVYRHDYPEGIVLGETGEPDQQVADLKLLYLRVWKRDFLRATNPIPR